MTYRKTAKNHSLPSAILPGWFSLTKKNRPPRRAGPRGLFIHFNPPALLLCLLFILLTPFPANASENSPGKILVLNSYHPGYSWSDSILTGIREGLAEAGLQAELDIEYLDTKQYLPQNVFPVFAELLKVKFKRQLPSLIIANDNNALDFLLNRRSRLFPNIPIVFCGINDFSEEMIRGQTMITGVAEDHSYRETLELARRLHPERTTLVAVSDVTESGRMNLAGFRKAAEGLDKKVTIIELNGLPKAQLQKRLRNLPAKAVLFHLDYYLTPEGTTLTVEESFNLLRANSSLPIYVNTDNKIGFGALGGVVATGRLQGLTAARMASRILRGASPDDIPILRRAPSLPVFDFKVLREFSISLDQLPENSKIINQPRSFYSLYKNYIQATVVFIAALFTLIFFLLNNIRLRKTTENDLRESERRFRETLENMELISVQLDGKGIIVFANQYLAGLTGYSREELAGMDWFSTLVPESSPEVKQEFLRAMRAGDIALHVENPIVCKDGRERFVRWNNSLLRAQTGEIIGTTSIGEDITARRQAEEKLQANLQLLQQTLASLDETVMLIDTETRQIYECNATAEKMFGYSRQELIGQTTEFLHVGQESFLGFKEKLLAQLENGDHFEFEYRMKRKNGEIFPTEHYGRPIMQEGKIHTVVSVIRDISERKGAEAELKKHRDHLEELIGKRTDDLREKLAEIERINRLFVDRELRMAELKEKIKNLETR